VCSGTSILDSESSRGNGTFSCEIPGRKVRQTEYGAVVDRVNNFGRGATGPAVRDVNGSFPNEDSTSYLVCLGRVAHRVNGKSKGPPVPVVWMAPGDIGFYPGKANLRRATPVRQYVRGCMS
jgi:hypothetical protein